MSKIFKNDVQRLNLTGVADGGLFSEILKKGQKRIYKPKGTWKNGVKM